MMVTVTGQVVDLINRLLPNLKHSMYVGSV